MSTTHTHKGGHTMFNKLINWFNQPKQTELEAFIVSKNPQNEAEVEYWSRWYDAHGALRGL